MKSLLITMAGESSRFRAAGVTVPKWALNIDNKNILTRAMESVASYARSADCETIFVSRIDHGARESINRCCKDLGIDNFRLMELPETPSGQALTASVAVKTLQSDSSILIWNVDTSVCDGALDNIPDSGNWLSAAPLLGNHWSFAEVLEGKIIRTTEKIRISDWASIGLYGFQDPDTYLDALSFSIKNASNETYIAPMYNHLIAAGQEVFLHTLEAENVVPLGTPNEVTQFCHNSGFSVPLEMQHL